MMLYIINVSIFYILIGCILGAGYNCIWRNRNLTKFATIVTTLVLIFGWLPMLIVVMWRRDGSSNS